MCIYVYVYIYLSLDIHAQNAECCSIMRQTYADTAETFIKCNSNVICKRCKASLKIQVRPRQLYAHLWSHHTHIWTIIRLNFYEPDCEEVSQWLIDNGISKATENKMRRDYCKPSNNNKGYRLHQRRKYAPRSVASVASGADITEDGADTEDGTVASEAEI